MPLPDPISLEQTFSGDWLFKAQGRREPGTSGECTAQGPSLSSGTSDRVWVPLGANLLHPPGILALDGEKRGVAQTVQGSARRPRAGRALRPPRARKRKPPGRGSWGLRPAPGGATTYLRVPTSPPSSPAAAAAAAAAVGPGGQALGIRGPAWAAGLGHISGPPAVSNTPSGGGWQCGLPGVPGVPGAQGQRPAGSHTPGFPSWLAA
jgi:hypothetical protein